MTGARWIVLALALIGALYSAWQLERMRQGISISALQVGTTPATVYRLPTGGPAPVVVIAHGFAGSRQLMEGFALVLARAGYIAVSYDLQGHGRNPVPMSGDVTKIGGTTKLLMDELARVSEAAMALPGTNGQIAFVGHSMASDIVVRQAVRDARVGAVVAVSMFSSAVTATSPRNLLIVAGAWETMLAGEALKAVRLMDPKAEFSQTIGDLAAGTGRRAVLAPSVEHVGVLYAPTTLRETRDWLNASFNRSEAGPVPVRGGWIALLLVSVIAIGWPLAGLMGRARAARPPPHLPAGRFLLALLVPAVATPLLLWPVKLHFLPVLVADYLALHFMVYGIAVLVFVGGFRGLRRQDAKISLTLALAVAAFGVVVFGGALDRYVASFQPVGGRVAVVVAMMAGTVPFMLSDAVLTEGGRAALWRVLLVRGASLGSLGLAIALNFERLFFLIIILPIILLFFVLFGTVGGWVGRATWRPAVAGIGLGLFLAWALGVTFPMFAA